MVASLQLYGFRLLHNAFEEWSRLLVRPLSKHERACIVLAFVHENQHLRHASGWRRFLGLGRIKSDRSAAVLRKFAYRIEWKRKD
jgi:hypothetical protein